MKKLTVRQEAEYKRAVKHLQAMQSFKDVDEYISSKPRSDSTRFQRHREKRLRIAYHMVMDDIFDFGGTHYKIIEGLEQAELIEKVPYTAYPGYNFYYIKF